jgi:hypothetical protein
MKNYSVFATCVALGLSGPAQADTYCGPSIITKSLTYVDGSVKILAPWRGDYIQICNLKLAWKSIDPQLCFAWFSKINVAVSQGKRIGIYYYSLQPGDCATMPTYDGAPSPGYVELTP